VLEKFIRYRLFTLIIFLMFVSMVVHSQPQYHNWNFGFGGSVTFSSGSPVATPGSAMTTDEGVASISNSGGQLLFYTNGEEVFNRNHQQMLNGNGLKGSFTTAQSVVIVPLANDTNQFMLFTQAPQAGLGFAGNGNSGLSWSKVEMNLDGGLGAVTTKNVNLADSTCESLCATLHANGKESWVVVHKWRSNLFYAFRVGCEGIVSSPVISSAGRVHDDTTEYAIGTIGCMKISPDGSKLAIVWSQFSNEADSHARLDIFDFDNGNGKITFRDSINFSASPTAQERGYGVEFSPNSKFVYTSLYGLQNGIAFTSIYQVSVEDSNPDATKQVVANGFNAFGTLQLGPDNKIYVARLNGYPWLSSINQPDSLGPLTQFTDQAVALPGPVCTWGLPNNWNAYRDAPLVDLISQPDTTLCNNESIIIRARLPFNDPSYQFQWSTGQTSANIIVQPPGIFSVMAFNGCDTIYDSIRIDGINCPCEVIIPNIVTVNQDGFNDYFAVGLSEFCIFNSFNMEIYNRWGNKIFSSTDVGFRWEPATSGSYYYIFRYSLDNFKDEKPVVKKGVVTVIAN
jgi:hypothetical protein